MKTESKRQNFNVTPEQEAEIAWLRDAVDAPSTKDAVLSAVRIMATLVRESRQGKSLYLVDDRGEKERLLIPELSNPATHEWKYLVARPHPWRRQLYVKGHRLMASDIWMGMVVNNMTADEAASNWDLPLEAIDEAIRYCSENEELIGMEIDEERRLAIESGVDIGD